MTSQSLTDSQKTSLAIWFEVNASLSAYKKLIQAFATSTEAWQASHEAWQSLGIHHKHLQRHKDSNSTTHFLEQVDMAISQGEYQLIFIEQPLYPDQLKHLYDPPPLLFIRGNMSRLTDAQIAIVGSRKPTPHAQKISFDMAQYLAESGYIITSGLAQGVDLQAHLGALTQSYPSAKGRTLGVMGTAINVCYPSHHHRLFSQILDEGGCLISELLPNTPANKHTFPRRNRLVAGLSQATIVTEATIKSGSLITARLASEQGKQVFAVPSHIDNVNAEGCHHLIREGATLVYHPEQVLTDIRRQFPSTDRLLQPTTNTNTKTKNNIQPVIQTQPNQQTPESHRGKPQNGEQNLTQNTSQDGHSQNTSQNTISECNTSTQPSLPLPPANSNLPTHLHNLYTQIDWSGADLDALIMTLDINAQTLLGQLMELELKGLIMQQSGRYVRV